MSRVQLSRRRGWRMPPGAVKIARPGPWGNPHPVVDGDRADAVCRYREWLIDGAGPDEMPAGTRAYSRTWQRGNAHLLIGRTLACWCPTSGPCHADVLAELAVMARP